MYANNQENPSDYLEKSMTDQIYYIDVQVIQTGAYDRGMGKYFLGLLFALLKNEPNTKFILFYTTNLPDVNVLTLKKSIKDKLTTNKISFQALDLKLHSFRKNNYDDSYAKNRDTVSNFISRDSTSDHKVLLTPCLMQEPIVPVIVNDTGTLDIVIWYDLNIYLFSEHHFIDQGSAYPHSYLKRINMLLKADHIFAISHKSKSDLMEYISIPEKRITVINGYVSNLLVTSSSKKPFTDINTPFFLCPASAEPSKNVLNTIKGFGKFNNKHKDKYSLVITSKYDPKIASMAETYATNVVFIGHIEDGELRWLYEHCEGLLFVSAYEGLGMPILEAVHFNKKVICSDIPVFIEISNGNAFYWCRPDSPESISAALHEAVNQKSNSSERNSAYEDIKKRYAWGKAAKTLFDSTAKAKKLKVHNKTIAVVGPHPASFSSVGKFAAETVPYLLERVNVHYYYDSGPSDMRFGRVHFHYLSEYDNIYPIEQLPSKVHNYDSIIYHIGSSDHHMKTYLLSKIAPATVILHDTDLAGKGLAGQMLSNGFLSEERYKAEVDIEAKVLQMPERFITSIVSSQSKIVTHSDFAADIAKGYSLNKAKFVKLNHPVSFLDSPRTLPKTGPLRIGFAGIMGEAKGVNMLEWLFEETDNLSGCELYIFGFGFFIDKSRLYSLEANHPNLKVMFDVSNLVFQQVLSSLDLLINYRLEYHGEASRTVLEAMRARVVPIVRNIGWFSELPKDTCFQLDSLDRIPGLINKLKNDPETTRAKLSNMIEASKKLLKESFTFESYADELLRGEVNENIY